MSRPFPADGTQPTRVAVEFLTLWLEPDRVSAVTHINEVTFDMEKPEIASTIAGLLNLSMVLLIMLVKERFGGEMLASGDPFEAARGILRDFSAGLPEREENG